MKAKYIQEIVEIITKMDENKILYLLTFIKKWIGSF